MAKMSRLVSASFCAFPKKFPVVSHNIFLGLELIPAAVTPSYYGIMPSACDLLSPDSLFMDCTNISHSEENPIKKKAV